MREQPPIPPGIIEQIRPQPHGSYSSANFYPEMDAEQASVPLSHYLWIVRRHKWRILGFIAICMTATFIVSSRLQPIYEATAKVDVDRRAPSGVIGQEANQVSSANDSDQFLATQIELIQSDAVLRPVAMRYNLLQRESQLDKLDATKSDQKANAPVLLNKLKITRPTNTYVLRIAYRSTDPQLAADVANGIAQSYLEHTFNIRIRSSSALSNFMEKQMEELRAKMERSGLALAQFERELNVINPEEKTSILSARLLQLNTEYTTAQSDRVRKEAAANSMKSGSIEAAQVSTQGEALGKLSERLNEVKQHFTEVSTTYGERHAEYRKAANQLAEVQRQFEDTRRNISKRIDTDYRQAMNREQMLRNTVSETKAEYDRLNARSFEYQQLKREADADKSLHGDLVRRIKEAGINAGFQNSAIRIADLARPAATPIFPDKKLNLMLAFVISTLLALGGALMSDVLDNTIRDPEQAGRSLDIDVIGTLPMIREMKRLIGPATPRPVTWGILDEKGANNRTGAVTELGLTAYNGSSQGSTNGNVRQTTAAAATGSGYKGISSYEEAIRTLRNSILLADFDNRIRSLLITSASPGEGKSTTVIHLAIAHAEQGKRTLIIDADLRRPSVHKKLAISGTTGLSNVLLGEISWTAAVIKGEQWPNLDVIPSGPPSRRASDLIGPMMIDILDEAAKEYDLILVDAPPLLGFAEAMQIAKATDGVVVMTRAGQTSRKAVATVLTTLKRLRTNVIGLVLNEVNKNTSSSYYYYGYYRKYYAGAGAQNG
jgi:capsular exopolysaccharide synthesis family protein